MAFVYRCPRIDLIPDSTTNKTFHKHVGNGRDILSQIVVELFPKKIQQKKLPMSKSNDNSLLMNTHQIFVGYKQQQTDERDNDLSIIKKQNMSSIFKSVTKRSLFADINQDNSITQTNKSRYQQSLMVNGKQIDTTHIEDSTILVSDRGNLNQFQKDQIDQFEKLLFYQGDSERKQSSFDQLALAPIQKISYHQKNEYLRNPELKTKGFDFAKSKVKREVFQPKEIYQSQFEQEYQEVKPKIKKQIKYSKRIQQKLLTASTMNTQVWGDESEDDDQQQEYIETTPGPGYYEPVFQNKNFRTKYPHVFNSNQPKIKPLKCQNQNLGPWSYGADYTSFHCKGSYISKCQRFEAAKPKDHEAQPGSYNIRMGIQSNMIKEILKSPVSQFGANSVRFNFKDIKNIPGPGNYNVKRYLQPSSQINANVIGRQKHTKTKQSFQLSNLITPGPGHYSSKSVFSNQPNQFSSLYKIHHPFGSPSPRFQDPIKQTSLPRRKQQSVQIQPFFKPFNIGAERFEATKQQQSPVVGQYYNFDSEFKQWDKQSFNVLFH